MSRQWDAHIGTRRCPIWETRPVRAPFGGPGTRGHHTVQVRCMHPRGHEGPHQWRGVDFGSLQRRQPVTCGALTRSRGSAGKDCTVLVVNEGDRCRWHR